MYKEEIDIIKQGILNEVEGYEFYKLAAKEIDGQNNKNSFLELANEELKHINYLKDLLKEIEKADNDNIDLSSLKKLESPGIFTWDKVDKDFLSLAISVYSIGIQMEKDSIEFYEQAKKKTIYEKAKDLYDLLIKWENVHLEQFTKQYDLYTKDWWLHQGFAPY
ncbi:rubrerythrin [Soehngenia saccharolytica]|jgi:rubrerythrin|nr:rubrerythrin [Soehngenia saccharolytica]